MQTTTDDRDPVEILGEQFIARRRAGENVSVDAYANEHPELADDIRRLFRTMLVMERFKSAAQPVSESSVLFEIQGLQQLGDYRIIREIGRGGMGIVYEAEQQSLRRNVAVKVFPRKVLSSSRQLKRFQSEAQTAASLHHTNIVPVFGVGQHDDLHYFVMQRINGIALDEYVRGVASATSSGSGTAGETDNSPVDCVSTTSNFEQSVAKSRWSDRSIGDSNSPAPEPRSPTFRAFADPPFVDPSGNLVAGQLPDPRWVATVGIQVAKAVGFAHDQGVLHRDIKPSNLLLDPRGTIWVTDFGLAIAIDPNSAGQEGEVAGTLRYMAPEHLKGEQTARGDIYSLGLTLYEMLTLKPAFMDKSRVALVDRINSGDFPAPRAIRASVPKDLEAILLKATQNAPADRYQSMAELSEDLGRFADGRPVRARSVGPPERLWRWSRRNPLVAGLSAALLIGAIGSFALVSNKWREAVAENRRAEANLSLALESMDQILQRFGSSWMADPAVAERDPESMASDVEFQVDVSAQSIAVLQDALKFYDRFAKQNATNTALQRDTAKVHRRVGDIYDRLGQYANAEAAHRRALKILDAELADASDPAGQAELVLERARTLNGLGNTQFARSEFDKASNVFGMVRGSLQNSPFKGRPEFQAELATAYNNLGRTDKFLHAHERAIENHRLAVGLWERVVQQKPSEASYRLALAHAYRNYFTHVVRHGDRGQTKEIKHLRSSGIKILEQLVDDFPGVPDYKSELSEMLIVSCSCRAEGDEKQRRADRLARAASLAQELVDDHPTIPRYRFVRGRVLREFAGHERKTDRESAKANYAEAVVICRSLAEEFPDVPVYHMVLAFALKDQAENLWACGDAGPAKESYYEATVSLKDYLTLRPETCYARDVLQRIECEMTRSDSDTGSTVPASRFSANSKLEST